VTAPARATTDVLAATTGPAVPGPDAAGRGGPDRAGAGQGSPGPAGTSTAPTGKALWRRGRGPVLAALLVVVVSTGLAALRSTGDAGQLDPRAYDPGGSRAVAALLADRGVLVRVVGDLPGLRAELGPRSTVLVPLPAALTDDELGELGRLGARLVVTGAGPAEVEGLGLPVDVQPAELAARRPACDLPAAAVAGTALTGRASYRASAGVEAIGCYATGGRATVLTLPATGVTLVGAPDLLTNDELDTEGSAALALGLLSGGDEVLWLLPDAGRAVTGGRVPLRDLLPDAVLLGALQLAVAVVLLALWRARRLGRVVTEPLPVVVRAAEAVEGRSRLYRAAGARDTAAEALRAGARDRLARRLGLPPGGDPGALVGTLADRTGRDPAEVTGLLYGAPPADDAALVRLADALDALSP